MLVCRECGSNNFTADFDVTINVSGRIQSMGPILDSLPSEASDGYASLYHIKVETPVVFSKLRWQDAKLIECRRCGGRNVEDDISICPECSSPVSEDQVVFCRGGKRVVCIHCVNEDWCFTCPEDECKFRGKSPSIFYKARQRIKKSTPAPKRARLERDRPDGTRQGVNWTPPESPESMRESLRESLRSTEMPQSDEARTPQPTAVVFTDDDEEGETY